MDNYHYVKRNTQDELKGLSSLSLINPWHAAMKLFDSTVASEDVEEEPEVEFNNGLVKLNLRERVPNVGSRYGFAMRNLFPTL